MGRRELTSFMATGGNKNMSNLGGGGVVYSFLREFWLQNFGDSYSHTVSAKVTWREDACMEVSFFIYNRCKYPLNVLSDLHLHAQPNTTTFAGCIFGNGWGFAFLAEDIVAASVWLCNLGISDSVP